MTYTLEKRSVMSTDGIHELKTLIYRPSGEIKGIFQIAHGMQEYIGRYDKFMSFMAENGWLCFGHDHLGHGETGKAAGEFGYFAHKDGWSYVVNDVHKAAEEVRAEFPDKKIVLMGHSMGSFIVRLTAARFGGFYDALIIMGTGGPNPASGLGIALASMISGVKGERHISNTIENMAFGTYCKRCKDEAPLGWLTRREDVRQKYAADPFCSYHFTVSALKDLVIMNKKSNENPWFSEIARTNIPIFIVSGSEDPVGEWSRGVRKVWGKLKKAGVRDLELKLYDGARHEILNDLCADEVSSDILSWSEKRL